jgi:Tol biopolymer transport system component
MAGTTGLEPATSDVAGTTGLEPATSDVTGRRSNQLNYVPAMSRKLQGTSGGIGSGTSAKNMNTPQPPHYRSRIAVYDLAARSTRTVYQADQVIEAPNWSRVGKFLLINTEGHLYRLPLNSSGEPKLEQIDLGPGGYVCNNDHDLSRDGDWLAFSASSRSSKLSQVYLAKSDGSGARLMTPAAPSYFHGWSPDGKWLAFVGQRDKVFNAPFHLYRVSRDGGEEQRLTSQGTYDDGPEYSPDGKWIYFNSNRSGSWRVWRMPPDGAGPGRREGGASHRRRMGRLVPALSRLTENTCWCFRFRMARRLTTTAWMAWRCA